MLLLPVFIIFIYYNFEMGKLHTTYDRSKNLQNYYTPWIFCFIMNKAKRFSLGIEKEIENCYKI